MQFCDISTDKSGPNMLHFDFQIATVPGNFSTVERQKMLRGLQFFNILTVKCAFRQAACNFATSQQTKVDAVFCTFWLSNVLFATVPGNFSTVERQKMLRGLQFFNILTFKCAFRHSGVQFSDIWTSKSGPNLRCFVHFDLQMCFSPSGVQFLMSPLSTYLRTRRFNRPTFGLTRHTNLWKNTAFRDFSNIWRGCIFFRLTFWLLHLLSTDLITLLLLFNSPYCRKFLFKLPSIIWHHFLDVISYGIKKLLETVSFSISCFYHSTLSSLQVLHRCLLSGFAKVWNSDETQMPKISTMTPRPTAFPPATEDLRSPAAKGGEGIK